MFLIKKGKDKFICAEYSLKYRLKNGYELIKPVFDIPRSAIYRPVYQRNTYQIILWYQEKIEALTEKVEGYKKDLKKFRELTK